LIKPCKKFFLLLVHDHTGLDLCDGHTGTRRGGDIPVFVKAAIFPGLDVAVFGFRGGDLVRTGELPLGNINVPRLHDHHGLPLIRVVSGVHASNVIGADLFVGFVLNRNGNILSHLGQNQISHASAAFDLRGILLVDQDTFPGISLFRQVDAPVMVFRNSQLLDVLEGRFDLQGEDSHFCIVCFCNFVTSIKKLIE